jgi:plasmid maintenance system killer protein
MLGRDVRVSGLKFEKIKGCDAVYTVRVDREYRLSMRQLNGKWELLRIAKHDEVYRNPGC